MATYLVGYDASPESHAAVELTADLAKAAGAEVIAAYVRRPPVALFWVAAATYQLEELDGDARREAEEIVERLDVPGVGRFVVTADSPARGIHDLAQTTGAELIAVGVTHRGPFGRLAPGSVGMHLLHGAPCPVLAVPPDGSHEGVHTVGVAYDGREESEAALRYADDLAMRLDATLMVIGALQPVLVPVAMVAPTVPPSVSEDIERRFRTQLDKAAQSTRAAAETRLLNGSPASTLSDASADVDLMVTGSRGYGAIGGVILGSVSRHLVDHAHCPVLVVPRPAGDR